jgi:hypothetical protein
MHFNRNYEEMPHYLNTLARKSDRMGEAGADVRQRNC